MPRKLAAKKDIERGTPAVPTTADIASEIDFPLDTSVGYQIRMAHRATQRYLQMMIEPHGVSLGMWYFLRALWQEDGLTQRELSRRIGTMEPTTLNAIASMERAGIVRRKRNREDKRKINVFLTPKGQELKDRLLPLAAEVVDTATRNFSTDERNQFLKYLTAVQRNLADETALKAITIDL